MGKPWKVGDVPYKDCVEIDSFSNQEKRNSRKEENQATKRIEQKEVMKKR